MFLTWILPNTNNAQSVCKSWQRRGSKRRVLVQISIVSNCLLVEHWHVLISRRLPKAPRGGQIQCSPTVSRECCPESLGPQLACPPPQANLHLPADAGRDIVRQLSLASLLAGVCQQTGRVPVVCYLPSLFPAISTLSSQGFCPRSVPLRSVPVLLDALERFSA
jgi:hypothetical protein